MVPEGPPNFFNFSKKKPKNLSRDVLWCLRNITRIELQFGLNNLLELNLDPFTRTYRMDQNKAKEESEKPYRILNVM